MIQFILIAGYYPLVLLLNFIARSKLIIWIYAEASVRVFDLLIIAIRHEFVSEVLAALLDIRWRFDRMLRVALTSLISILSLDLQSQLPPVREEASHIFHPMVCVEECSHSIE